MEMDVNFWTATETNKFIFKQLKQLLVPEGFIVCPKASKYLIRIHDHHVEIVYQEILYGETRLQLIVSPSWTYEKGWCFHGDLFLKYSNDPNEKNNFYSRIAVRKEPTMKAYYKSDEMINIWNNVIQKQLKSSIIDYFNELNYDEYFNVCKNRGDGFLTYGSSIDSVYLFSLAYNHFWNKDYVRGKDFLDKAISVSEEHLEKVKKHGGIGNPEFIKDLTNGKEIYSLLKEYEFCKKIEDRLSLLEKDAMIETWGIELDTEKNITKKHTNKV